MKFLSSDAPFAGIVILPITIAAVLLVAQHMDASELILAERSDAQQAILASRGTESPSPRKAVIVKNVIFAWDREKSRPNGYGYDYSAARNELVYTDKDNELYVRDLSTGGTRLLVKMPGKLRTFRPLFSPDGSKIGFTASGPEAFPEDIYLVNSDGSGLRKLTQSTITQGKPGEGSVYLRFYLIEFSPTGSRVLVRYSEGGRKYLGIMSTAGGELEILVDGWWNPFWSSDERKVYCFDAFNEIMVTLELDTRARKDRRIYLGLIVAHAPDRDEIIIGRGNRYEIAMMLHSLTAPPVDIHGWASGILVNLIPTERITDPELLTRARNQNLSMELGFHWARWVTRGKMLVVQGNEHFERVEIRRVGE